MININVRKDDVFGDGCYKVIASAEIAERGHRDDYRMGVSIDVEQTDKGLLWSTHEYNAEMPNRYYNGHYFMENQCGAWEDFFKRCDEIAKYAHKWYIIKGDKSHID